MQSQELIALCSQCCLSFNQSLKTLNAAEVLINLKKIHALNSASKEKNIYECMM